MPHEETEKHDGVSGTAWAIDNDHMITAGHVCESATEAHILKKAAEELRLQQHGSDGLLLDEEIFARIIAFDPVKDICLLESVGHPFVPLVLAPSLDDVEVEDPVYTLGAPKSTFPVRTEGHVIQLNAEDWPGKFKEMLFLKLDIDHGSSGGPVMWAGQVIGMTVILLRYPHESCFAVPVHHLHEFIEEHLH